MIMTVDDIPKEYQGKLELPTFRVVSCSKHLLAARIMVQNLDA